MSSSLSTHFLIAANLNSRRRVVAHARLSDALIGTCVERSAKVLINLFQAGMTDRAELQTELEKRLVLCGTEITILTNAHHYVAIRGPTQRGTTSAMTGCLEALPT